MDNINIIFLDGIEPPNSSYSCFMGYLFPLGAVLEEANYSFRILSVKNLRKYSIEGIIQELKKYQFDSIGMTTNADNIRFVYKICDEIKKHYPTIPIILGGPHVSYADEDTLKKCNCDIVIRDEGEKKLLEIIRCLTDKVSYEGVKGISYKKGDKIIRNENPLPLDINQLPTPQYAILSDLKYWLIPTGMSKEHFSTILLEIKKSYNFFMTGRGCPYRCAFCVEGIAKKKYQFRSVENVKKDLIYFLQKTEHTFVAIADDTFTSSPRRVRELCDVFIEIQKVFPFIWFCEGRVDIISSHLEMINLMYHAGLRKLQIGIESGNQRILDIYKKGITLNQIEIVVKECVKYNNLILAGNLILGNPHESLFEFKEGLEFIKHLLLISNFKLDITTSYLAPFCGTPIRNEPEKFGIEIIPDFEFCRIGMLDIVSKPATMLKEELDSLKVLTEKELAKVINEHIFTLPKDYILSFYSNESSLSQMPSALYKSWWRLSSFKKYLKIRDKALVVNPDSVTVESCWNYSPLKLWNIDYDCGKKEYYFMELTGKKYVIREEKIFLWQQASGKKSIYKIFEESNRISLNIPLKDIIEFYKGLESKWALLFIRFS